MENFLVFISNHFADTPTFMGYLGSAALGLVSGLWMRAAMLSMGATGSTDGIGGFLMGLAGLVAACGSLFGTIRKQIYSAKLRQLEGGQDDLLRGQKQHEAMLETLIKRMTMNENDRHELKALLARSITSRSELQDAIARLEAELAESRRSQDTIARLEAELAELRREQSLSMFDSDSDEPKPAA